MTFTVTPADLSDFLGVQVDVTRAVTVLNLAQQLCATIVAPLPDNALPVVIDVAARAYTNPVGASSQVAGPFSTGGTPGGIYLTRVNKATLRRLAGGGGAFTVETCPDTAGDNLPWWDYGNIQTDSGTFASTGDFDPIP